MVTMKHNQNLEFSKAHLTSLDLNNFKMIKAMGLKLFNRGFREWLYLLSKFHENLPSGSKVISGRTHRKTDRLVI
jgi:hypothetical protein